MLPGPHRLAWVRHEGRSVQDKPYNGGERAPPQSERWPWMEVMHQPNVADDESDARVGTLHLWLYAVRGTGLWYNPGRVLSMADHIDLADYLNFSQHRKLPRWWRNAANFIVWGPELFKLAAKVLAPSYDTISFRAHVDIGCCGGMRMHELVSLHHFWRGCPVSKRLRRGWHGSLRPCDCADPNRPANGTRVPRGGTPPRRRGTAKWKAVC